MKITSTWFAAFSLAFLICAFACRIALTLAPRPALAEAVRSHRSLVERLFAGAMPPGWTARHGLYLSEIAGPDGRTMAYTSIGSAGDGRPLLFARVADDRSRAGG